MIKTLDLEYNGHQFADKILKLILLYENCWILIQISLKFLRISVTKMSELVQIMVGHQTGDWWTHVSLSLN